MIKLILNNSELKILNETLKDYKKSHQIKFIVTIVYFDNEKVAIEVYHLIKNRLEKDGYYSVSELNPFGKSCKDIIAKFHIAIDAGKKENRYNYSIKKGFLFLAISIISFAIVTLRLIDNHYGIGFNSFFHMPIILNGTISSILGVAFLIGSILNFKNSKRPIPQKKH
ncbi:MAG: hypothetical protein P1U41_02845 [Vicingaceae bacterium]|nr:hypothetical protein [Vicingaceae bacterium]